MAPRTPSLGSAGRPRFATLLAASALGVYILVLAGATATIAEAVEACGTWPTCNGPVLDDSALLVAWGHRILAAIVGVLVLATAVVARTEAADRRVGGLLAVVLVFYPVQIVLGALIATTGGAAPFPGVHLVTGMAIFAALVGALAWQLEVETGSDDERARTTAPEAAATPVDAAETADGQESDGPTPELSGSNRLLATLGAYARLTKPRLMWLLCLVASAGMALAAGPNLTTRIVVLTLGGGVLAIGASGTFNHVLERDVDRKMNRISDRPVATHELPVRNAVAFGVALAAAAVGLFWQVNALAAALGLGAILFYSVVYTLVLKPNTVQNTVLGGFAGSLPALIGWVAVTGTIGLPGLALAVVIFLWTPAHFYNLAMAYEEDYARGGFPMMPVVRGETETRKHVLLYLGATLAAAGAMTELTRLGPLYAVTTALFGAVFLWAVVKLHREQTDRAAFRAFHASNAYLGALLLAIVVDTIAL